MPLHFSQEEYGSRIRNAVSGMEKERLDGLLLFNQCSKYYLTGYDSFGFVLFECLYLGADGRMVLLTRPTDVPAAFHTSIIRDVRVWIDREGHDPATDLRSILAEFGCRGRRLGVEYQTWGLTGRNALRLNAALDDFCELVDASELIARQRAVKSDAELDYVRQAAVLTDAAFEAARERATAGAFEGDILAAAQARIFEGGGDYPGNEFTIGSGEGALLARYFSGRRTLAPRDQLVLQIGGAYRRYHAAVMGTICIGGADAHHRKLHGVARDALCRMHDALRPGRTLGEVFSHYRSTVEAAGLAACRLSSSGYSLGAAYHPTWMDWPWLFEGSEVVIEPNMVFYLHSVLMDRDQGYAMALADTSVVTPAGSERLSHVPLDLLEA